MKSIFKFIPVAAVAAISTGCATMLAPRTAQVALYDVPPDLEVTENGAALKLVSVMADAKSRTNYEGTVTKTTAYYTPGLKLDKKHRHELLLKTKDKSATLVIKPRMSGGWFITDLLFTGPLGIIVDAATGNWKVLRPRNVDVPALLNGTKPRGKNKLKKDLRRNLKK